MTRVVYRRTAQLYAYRREANGQWELMPNGRLRHWPTAWDQTITDVVSTTRLKFECIDYGGWGGFIATVHYGGQQYSTTTPLSTSRYEIIEGDTGYLSYRSKTASPWHRQTAGIAADAMWVWNEKLWNTMTFEFTFQGLNTTQGEQQCYFFEGNPVECSQHVHVQLVVILLLFLAREVV